MSRSAGRPTLAALAEALRTGRFDPSALSDDPRIGARQLAARWARRRARLEEERRRLERLFALEREAWAEGLAPVAGVDEAGRGPLAGPVVAAAVIFPAEQHIPHLRDSKQVRPGDREVLYEALMASGAMVGIGIADVEEINRFNILGATGLAWSRALASLGHSPALVLVDGNRRAPVTIPQRTIVGGDARCASIAAASVVAKVTRDRLMVALDRRLPQYGFARHKGYATAEHLAALRRWGPSPVHRRVFLPADLQQVPLLFP
ncbi:MAG: ribonuclease HII [Armatimonadetes bacterium]|nr:ribonuclease HII [Armatimonadota bacterium]